MKILVFEYVTGGGMSGESIPDSLFQEGLLMLKALVKDLLESDDKQLLIPLDERLQRVAYCFAHPNIEIIYIKSKQVAYGWLKPYIVCSDAVWIIAPEIDGILYQFTRLVEDLGKINLASPSTAVFCTSDKLSTYQRLLAFDIDAVPTKLFKLHGSFYQKDQVVKPVNGMGCENTYLINCDNNFATFPYLLDQTKQYIVQPYVEGETKSINGLFRNGNAWLLSVNQQVMEIVDHCFHLRAIEVNVGGSREMYQNLIENIAAAFPDLWGYVGIDFIENQHGLFVLEVNPRFTTSYVGLKQALGINVAELVIDLLNNEPVVNFTKNQKITIYLNEGSNAKD